MERYVGTFLMSAFKSIEIAILFWKNKKTTNNNNKTQTKDFILGRVGKFGVLIKAECE